MVARLERFDNTLYAPKKKKCTFPRKYKDPPCTLLKKYRKKHMIDLFYRLIGFSTHHRFTLKLR